MDLQKTYDTVRDHLLAQNAKAYDHDVDVCLYRDDAGLKCAVGCLIPDELYVPELEGVDIRDVADHRLHPWAPVVTRLGLERRDPGWTLLSRLQAVHDKLGVPEWPLALALVAGEFGLTP